MRDMLKCMRKLRRLSALVLAMCLLTAGLASADELASDLNLGLSANAPTEEQSGEVDSRGIIKGVEYVHPGNSVAIANHTEVFLNRGVIALVRECDGSSDGKCLVIGSKCNPLYMQPEYSNTKEASNRKFVWKQDMPDKFVIGTYAGALPALADAPSSEAGA